MDGDADLARIAALLGDMVPINPSGRLRFIANLKGTGTGFQIASRLNGQQLQLSGGALKGKPLILGAPSVLANGTMASDGSSFDFPQISIESPLLTGLVALSRKASSDGKMLLVAKGHASGQVDQLAASALEKPLDFTVGKADTNFDLSYSGDKLSIRQIGVKATVASAVIKGDLQMREAVGPEGLLNIDASGSIDKLIALSGKSDLPVNAWGQAKLKGNIRMGDAMGFDGSFAAQNLLLAGASLGTEPLRLGQLSGTTALTMNAAQGVLNLASFTAQCDPFSVKLSQPMSVTGFGATGGDMNFKAAFSGQADLAKLPGTLLRLPADARVTGATSFTGDMSWDERSGLRIDKPWCEWVPTSAPQRRHRARSVDGQCHRQGWGSILCDRGWTPTEDHASWQGSCEGIAIPDVTRWNSRGRSIGLFPLWTVTGSGLDIKGSGQWSEKASSRLNLNGSANLNTLSETWLPLFSDSLRGEGVAQLRVDMTTPSASKQGMKAATGAFNVTMPRMRMTGMDLSNLVVQGAISGGIAKISKGTAVLNEGAVGLGGQLDMNSVPWQWNGNVDAKNVEDQRGNAASYRSRDSSLCWDWSHRDCDHQRSDGRSGPGGHHGAGEVHFDWKRWINSFKWSARWRSHSHRSRRNGRPSHDDGL